MTKFLFIWAHKKTQDLSHLVAIWPNCSTNLTCQQVDFNTSCFTDKKKPAPDNLCLHLNAEIELHFYCSFNKQLKVELGFSHLQITELLRQLFSLDDTKGIYYFVIDLYKRTQISILQSFSFIQSNNDNGKVTIMPKKLYLNLIIIQSTLRNKVTIETILCNAEQKQLNKMQLNI